MALFAIKTQGTIQTLFTLLPIHTACGLNNLISHICDVRICLEPASVTPHEWPDDITKWPVSDGFLTYD